MAAPNEFLNPKSMVTPGIAGAMTMMITNTLHQQFGAPVNWTGLTISFVIGLIVFTAFFHRSIAATVGVLCHQFTRCHLQRGRGVERRWCRSSAGQRDALHNGNAVFRAMSFA